MVDKLFKLLTFKLLCNYCQRIMVSNLLRVDVCVSRKRLGINLHTVFVVKVVSVDA